MTNRFKSCITPFLADDSYLRNQIAIKSVCFVKGRRPVHIQTSWRLVDRGMSHTTRITRSVLTLEDMETIDFGNYICKAKNQNGETIVATAIVSK